MRFSNVIRSERELRSLMGGPIAPPVVEKTISSLDRHCLAFIGRAPFVLIVSSDSAGRMDISPKGDAKVGGSRGRERGNGSPGPHVAAPLAVDSLRSAVASAGPAAATRHVGPRVTCE